MVDELGTIIGTEAPQVPWPKDRRGDVPFHIRLNAAMYGYLYGNMAPLGVDPRDSPRSDPGVLRGAASVHTLRIRCSPRKDCPMPGSRWPSC